MDSFSRTKAPTNPYSKPKIYDPWVLSLTFGENTDHPIQVLEVPKKYFPTGEFPGIRRHWISSADGKTMPPIVCTREMANTGGHCLVCLAKEKGLINADHGNPEAGEELLIPIYDHGKYRKVDGKTVPVNPALLVSPQQRQGLIDGGLKVLYASEGQFSLLRNENENVKNECADCSSVMGLTGLACSSCDSIVVEQDLLNAMTMDEYNQAMYSEHECSVCGHSDILVAQRVCTSCGGSNSKNLFSVVVNAKKTSSVIAKTGRKRNSYSFARTLAYKPVTPSEEDLDRFFERILTYTTTGPVLDSQYQKLGGCLEIPKEWLKDVPQQPEPNVKKYGA